MTSGTSHSRLGFWGFGVLGLGFGGFGVLEFWGFGVLVFWGFGVLGVLGVLGVWGFWAFRGVRGFRGWGFRGWGAYEFAVLGVKGGVLGQIQGSRGCRLRRFETED